MAVVRIKPLIHLPQRENCIFFITVSNVIKAPTYFLASRFIKVLKTSKGNDFRVLPAMGSNRKNPSNSIGCGIFLYFQHLCGPASSLKVEGFSVSQNTT
jgi:hypothetical protein